MSGKKEKQINFEVQLNWLSRKKGVLSADDAQGTIHVATPPEFGGEGRPWTPEHLFLSSISGCFMTTFIAFAEKLSLPFSAFECPAIGRISFEEGRYRFSSIDLYPKICIAAESLREKANMVVAKSIKYCIISHAVNAPLIYHTEVLTCFPQTTVEDLIGS